MNLNTLVLAAVAYWLFFHKSEAAGPPSQGPLADGYKTPAADTAAPYTAAMFAADNYVVPRR